MQFGGQPTPWSEVEIEGLRLRSVSQILIQEIGAAGPENAEESARRACGVIQRMADQIVSADARIAELERECAQWRLELRIYRETENKRIAELERSVTVRDTEVARLETDLELARRDAERYWWLRDKWYLNKREQRCLDECLSLNPWADPPPEDFDNAIDAARAGNGGGV